ncbi:MAG: crotonase/enoyl-CoA hydratase family protein [Polyangiaceae bacterium]|nr:crotonase/enoyl-CoA hydratase family protein [Polyangiaceae bacterium]
MIRFEARGRVAIVTLDRPARRNAVCREIAEGMERALDAFEADPELWVGIVAAEGPAFCAGADLAAVERGEGASLSTERGGFAGIVRRARVKPLVAAVDGPALAGGCEVVLACDLVVASRAARFGLPEVKRSLVAAAGGLFRLPRALPERVALELVLTGDSIDAERAERLGLVNRLVEPGEALAGALALAGAIAANAPIAVQESLRIARRASEPDEVLWRESRDAFVRVLGTEDAREGPRAFLEKRAPAWRNR